MYVCLQKLSFCVQKTLWHFVGPNWFELNLNERIIVCRDKHENGKASVLTNTHEPNSQRPAVESPAWILLLQNGRPITTCKHLDLYTIRHSGHFSTQSRHARTHLEIIKQWTPQAAQSWWTHNEHTSHTEHTLCADSFQMLSVKIF